MHKGFKHTQNVSSKIHAKRFQTHTQKSIYLTNTWSRIEKILKHKKSTYKGYKKIHAQNSQTKLDITLKNT